MMNQDNVVKFETLLGDVSRDGMDDLLSFIRKSDFYTAPASTRYHSCHEGGLLEHTLNVYEQLNKKFINKEPHCVNVTHDNIVISALLHDICKTYFYNVEYRNKKIYDEHGTKRDEKGRFDWQSVPGYVVDDRIPYGHGEKSVMIVESYITLEPVERYAIRWHMGFTEPKESWNTLGAAIRKYPLILAIHESDLEATYLLEEEE